MSISNWQQPERNSWFSLPSFSSHSHLYLSKWKLKSSSCSDEISWSHLSILSFSSTLNAVHLPANPTSSTFRIHPEWNHFALSHCLHLWQQYSCIFLAVTWQFIIFSEVRKILLKCKWIMSWCLSARNILGLSKPKVLMLTCKTLHDLAPCSFLIKSFINVCHWLSSTGLLPGYLVPWTLHCPGFCTCYFFCLFPGISVVNFFTFSQFKLHKAFHKYRFEI